MASRWPSWQIPAWLRSVVAGAMGVAGAVFLARWLGRTVPLKNWFFFDLATIWAWCLVLCFACVVAGRRVVTRLLPDAELTPLETLALAFPAGVVVFVMGMYVGGFLHLWGRVFAVALPLVLIAAGGRPALAAWRAASVRPPRGLALPATILGLLLVGVLYLGAMTPDAINYDSTWLHMVIPQDYARAGHIISFPGDQVKNVPHLGAMLTTWGFLVPGLDLPQLRWMMALHIEFAVFVWTLVGIAAGARWLSDRDVSATWAAFLLFPGIFVYDSNLGGASDHFLALFVVPLLLATGRALVRFDRPAGALTGLLAGGALLSKFQAIYVIIPLGIWTVVRAGTLLVRRARGERDLPAPRDLGRTPLIAAGVALCVLLPHLLSNWVFYKNPMYPLFSNVFTGSTPSVSGGALQVTRTLADWHWHPPAALGERVRRALEMMFTFSFIPHYSFVDNLPVFGSTFTLSLPFLVTLKQGRRLWVGAFVGLSAVFLWAMSYWVDRNLQTFMPVLAAVTAAILVRAWELGWLARVGVAALVIIQLAWATPLYFSGSDRMRAALDLMRGSLSGQSREQLRGYRSQFVALGNLLPKDAVVMLHNQHVMLGINRPVILDWAGFQTIIDYRLFKTPRDLYDRLREIGVTHIVRTPGWRSAATKQEEVIFDVFADLYGRGAQPFGELVVFPMPLMPPPEEQPFRVLSIGMAPYPDGLYQVDALTWNDEFPPDMQVRGEPLRKAPSPSQLLDDARVILVGSGAVLDGAMNERLSREFRQLQAYGGFRVLLRNQ